MLPGEAHSLFNLFVFDQLEKLLHPHIHLFTV
jgi:hypothetical protein